MIPVQSNFVVGFATKYIKDKLLIYGPETKKKSLLNFIFLGVGPLGFMIYKLEKNALMHLNDILHH